MGREIVRGDFFFFFFSFGDFPRTVSLTHLMKPKPIYRLSTTLKYPPIKYGVTEIYS